MPSPEYVFRDAWFLTAPVERVWPWIVRADKPFIRLFSPLLKPLFAWNHDWTMRVGEAALRDQLAQASTSGPALSS